MRNSMQRNCQRCGSPFIGHPFVCPMTDEMLAALRQYKDAHGRTWRSRLSLDWTVGKDLGPALRQVRNIIGPSRMFKIRI